MMKIDLITQLSPIGRLYNQIIMDPYSARKVTVHNNDLQHKQSKIKHTRKAVWCRRELVQVGSSESWETVYYYVHLWRTQYLTIKRIIPVD